ncbi:MAG: hypothetical protein AB1333_04150 [Patescibacteria group bacterium]
MDALEQKWVVFDLDVNLFYGTVDTREKWNEIVARYRKIGDDIKDITKVRKHDRKEDRPAGFSFKGTGPTLAEWAGENNIDLSVV